MSPEDLSRGVSQCHRGPLLSRPHPPQLWCLPWRRSSLVGTFLCPLKSPSKRGDLGVLIHFSKGPLRPRGAAAFKWPWGPLGGPGTVQVTHKGERLSPVLVGPHLPGPGQLCHRPETPQLPALNRGVTGVRLRRAVGRMEWASPLCWLTLKPRLVSAISIMQPLDTSGPISQGAGEGGAVPPCPWGAPAPVPPYWQDVTASRQTDSAGFLPQNKKAKERGFIISCLATQGGKKQSETWKQFLGGPAVQGACFPAVSPQSRRTTRCRGRRSGKGNRKSMAG